jgi:hypothetical protein
MGSPSQAILGYGTILERGDGASPTENFAAIAEVLDINGPNRSRDFEDVTHQQSPGGYLEWLPKLKNGGELKFDLHFLPKHASQTALNTDYEAGTKTNYRIKWPFTPPVIGSFSAFVQEPPTPTAPVNGKLTATCTLKLTGPFVIA